jgi:acetoin utilization protein AcuB
MSQAMKHHKSQVQDYMTENPYVISPETSLVDAYSLMFEKEVRRLPVVQGQALVGIITLSDIQRNAPLMLAEAAISTRLEMATSTVGDVMTSDPITVAPDDTIQEAAECMMDNQVSGLPVVENDHVVGILTESDIFKLVVNWWAAGGIDGSSVSLRRAVIGTGKSKSAAGGAPQPS